jgi:PhnB protein
LERGEDVSNPPTGYHSVSPYLVTEDLEGLVGFVCNAFDGAGAPGNTWTAMLHVYLDDAGAAYRRALEAGATSVMDEHETPFGDRRYAVDDPWGNQWWISTRQ